MDYKKTPKNAHIICVTLTVVKICLYKSYFYTENQKGDKMDYKFTPNHLCAFFRFIFA